MCCSIHYSASLVHPSLGFRVREVLLKFLNAPFLLPFEDSARKLNNELNKNSLYSIININKGKTG